MTGDSNWSSVVTLVHFDGANASTSFHDSSLSAHAIAESFGGQITTSFAAFGTASADFVTNHGSGPCIRVANSPSADYQFGSGQFTIECWVYATTSNTSNYIMHTGIGGSGVGAWGLYYNSSTPALAFIYSTDGSTNTSISGTYTLPLNTWTHIAADYDGSTCRVYAGGVVIASSTLSGALYATTQELAIGDDNHTDSSPWNGYIDEVRVTKGVARYAGAFTAPSAAFPAYGTSPQPETSGAAGTGNATNASITYNLTTYEPNDIVVVAVFNENSGTGNPAVVSSITASGLTFAKRSSVSQAFGAGLEVWWALATNPLIALSMTIAFTGTFDDASSVACGVAGCATGAPWDSNGSLPATASTYTISGFSTTSADDCLVTFVGSETGPTNPFGFTTIGSTTTSAGTYPTTLITGYQDVSSPQSSITLSASTGVFAAFIADALTADLAEIDDSPAITGVAGTGAAGAITLSTNAAPTGVPGTGAAGSIVSTVTIVLAGVAATGSSGPAGGQSGSPISGVETDGQVGTPQTETDGFGALNGVETDGQVGTIQIAAGTIITLSDVFGGAQVNTLVIEIDAPGLGIAGTGQADVPLTDFDGSASITGVETDSAAGIAISVAAPVGVTASGVAGTPTLQYSATTSSLPGAIGTTQVGTIIASDATASAVTWNPNALGATASLSSNHFTFTVAVSGGAALTAGVRSTTGHITGKWYFEVAWTGPDLTAFAGLVNTGWSVNATTDLGWDNNSLSLYVDDSTVLNGVVIAPSGIGERAGCVYGCAVDFDAKLIWFTGTRMRVVTGFNWNNSSTANPATAVGGTSFSSMNAGPYFIAGEITGLGSSPANLVLNTGNSSFVFPIPAGFSPWDNTSFGVAAIGAVGAPVALTTIGGVEGTGMVALAGGHDHRLELFPILANVSVAIQGTSATGAAAALGVGFITSGASVLLNNRPFVFKGANFYEGYANPGTFAGLPHMSWQNNLLAIKALGFNSIRLGMFMAGIFDPADNWPLCSSGVGNTFAGGLNADLTGLNTLEFYDIVLDYCATIGLYVLADMHSTLGGIVSGFTSTGEFTLTSSPSTWSADGYTDTDYIAAWTTIATRWAGKPAFAACDMMNEPWGPGTTFTQWGPGAGVDLHDLFTRAGNAIHAAIKTVNPSYALPLIVCQTHDSDFSAVPSYPLTLTNANRAVYAPHVYPSPWENGYPASGGVDNGTGAMDGWNAAWGFLVATNTAPVYITEFGGTLSSMFPNQAAYWETLTPYILGISFYGGAPTQQVNWSVTNWDQIEGTIVGEDATGIVFALTNPATFYTTVVPYLPELIGSDLVFLTGVSGTGGVGTFQTPGIAEIVGVGGSGGVGFGLVSSGIVIQGVAGTAQVPARRPSFGAVAPAVSQAILGVSGSAAVQTLSGSRQNVPITGVGAQGSVGTLFSALIQAVNGIGQIGSLTVQAISSAVGFGQAGTITLQSLNTTTVSGVNGTGLVGIIAGAQFLAGVNATAQVGLDALSIQVMLAGAAGLGRASVAGPLTKSRQAVMMIAQ